MRCTTNGRGRPETQRRRWTSPGLRGSTAIWSPTDLTRPKRPLPSLLLPQEALNLQLLNPENLMHLTLPTHTPTLYQGGSRDRHREPASHPLPRGPLEASCRRDGESETQTRATRLSYPQMGGSFKWVGTFSHFHFEFSFNCYRIWGQISSIEIHCNLLGSRPACGVPNRPNPSQRMEMSEDTGQHLLFLFSGRKVRGLWSSSLVCHNCKVWDSWWSRCQTWGGGSQ